MWKSVPVEIYFFSMGSEGTYSSVCLLNILLKIGSPTRSIVLEPISEKCETG